MLWDWEWDTPRLFYKRQVITIIRDTWKILGANEDTNMHQFICSWISEGGYAIVNGIKIDPSTLGTS